MDHSKQSPEAQNQKKSKPTRPLIAVETVYPQVGENIDPGVRLSSADGTVEGQARQLSEGMLALVQRQKMAENIGRVQGNRHLNRVVFEASQAKKLPLQRQPEDDREDTSEETSTSETSSETYDNYGDPGDSGGGDSNQSTPPDGNNSPDETGGDTSETSNPESSGIPGQPGENEQPTTSDTGGGGDDRSRDNRDQTEGGVPGNRDTQQNESQDEEGELSLEDRQAMYQVDRMREDTKGGGYIYGNAYENNLDPETSDRFELLADPAQKERLTRMNAAADSARLGSLQYNYNVGGILYPLIQGVIPYDAAFDHLRAATTQNAYASSAGFSFTGIIAGLQTFLEFLRGLLRVYGDVIGASSTALGYFSLAAGALALIPPLSPALAPLAAAGALAAEALAIVKGVFDIWDGVIGVIQILANAVRARFSGDPLERARICQLMKKEAGDITGAISNAVLFVGTMGVGKGLSFLKGKAGLTSQLDDAGKILGQMEYSAALGQVGRSLKTEWTAISRTIQIHAVQAQMATTVGMKFTYTIKALKAGARRAGQVKAVGGTLSTRLERLEDIGIRQLEGGAGSVTGTATTHAKIAEQNLGEQGAYTGSSGPTENQAVPAEQGQVGSSKVAFWPSILEEIGSTREWIHNAQERMRDQYLLAKDDAGDKAKAVHAVFGGVSIAGSRMTALGMQEASKAAESKGQAGNISGAAANADQQVKAADAKSKGAQGKVQDTAGKIDTLPDQVNAAKAGADKGLLDTITDWVMDKALGTVFGYIGRAQKWINGKILWLALQIAGVNTNDLDLAGIERSALDEETASQAAMGDAQDTAAKGAQVDAKTAQLKEGASNSEKNAIQGMVDTMSWINELDGWDQTLAQVQDKGSAYIQQVAPMMGQQAEGEEGQGETQAITDRELAPLISSAASIKGAATSIPDEIRSAGTEELQALAGKLAAEYPGLTTDLAVSKGQTALNGMIDAGGIVFDSVRANVDRVLQSAQGLVGTQEFASLLMYSRLLQDENTRLQNIQNAIQQGFCSVLQNIADAYYQTYVESASLPGDEEPEPMGPQIGTGQPEETQPAESTPQPVPAGD